MAAPATLGFGGPAASNNHLAGAVVVTFAVIAFAEVARPARLLNIALGSWLMAAPWALSGGTDVSLSNDVVVGALLVALTVRRGRIEERFGAWNR